MTIKVSGKDSQGRNILRTAYAFNGIPKKMTYIIASPGFYINEVATYGANKVTATANGKISPTTTFKATVVCPFRYIGGQKCFGTGTTNTVFYQDGKFLAKSTMATTFSYKGFNGYYAIIKSTETTKTTYANGNTRKSIINYNYIRNSVGTLSGLKVSGTSQGTQKINSKFVNYTGKISMSTTYDPRDLLNEKFNVGNYKEILTSSAPKLLKFFPFESINWG